MGSVHYPEQPLRAERPCSRTFRIVEVSSGAVLADGIDMRATIEVLRRIDSIFDVSLAVWDPEAKAWRALTPGEQRALWDVRER
jgi:hypothetical protein